MNNFTALVSSSEFKRGLFGLVAFIFLFTAANAQVTINGIVVDKNSNDPISDAYVAWERGQMILSNKDGKFSINVSGFPIKLTFSHLSYGLTEITLEKEPENPFYIRLDKKLSEIGEVQVSGERLRILTAKDDYSIIDFAFDKNYMWMLGYVNNQANRQKLFLANPYGDTICTVNIRRAEKLYIDVFENVHLLTRDSAHQLHYTGDSVLFLYSSGRKRFDETMEGILCGFDKKLVYKTQGRYSLELYYLSEDVPFKFHLSYLNDTVGYFASIQDNKRDAAVARWNIPELSNMWKTVRSGYKEGSKVGDIIFPPVPMELFTLKDTLFVLNFLKDSLLCYSPEGKFERAVPVEFHYEKRLFGIDYKELEFISDPVTSKVYLTERRIAGWILHPFNTFSGKLEPEILLPDFAGMTNIQAHNDAVYFLYHEKLYPYFTRLYRFQL